MEEKTLLSQLYEYFGNRKVWVDAHDRESAQILADWLAHEIGDDFGTVEIEKDFWRYFGLCELDDPYEIYNELWCVTAYRNVANVRRLGLNIVDLEDFPFRVPGLTCYDFPDVDDLL